MKMQKTEKMVLVASCLGVLAACGHSGGNGAKPAAKLSQISIPATVTQADTAASLTGLGLADGTGFHMTMTGCASGFTATATEATNGLLAYKADLGCIVKLDSFTHNAATYQPSGGKPFTTWQVGDNATFVNASDASDVITVVVTSQLASPILATDTVGYAFSQVAPGTPGSIASSAVSGAHVLTVAGQSAPAFSVHGVGFDGIAAGGNGEFKFTMECADLVAGTADATTCRDVTVTALTYALVEDTFGGAPTLSNLNDMFVGGGAKVAPGSVLAAGTGGTTRGGFVTDVLNGPAKMHLHPRMILALKAGPSYQYFAIDVKTLTSNQ